MANKSSLFRAMALAPWLALLILLPFYPREAMDAAIRGVAIWWEVLFPALFPFFVVAELLLGFGIVHFIGCLFDPMMRPIFRVPGYGGFVMAMGFASGYPIGARLTSQLWEENLVQREEGERLVAFTSTSDPIFLIGAVSVGFFHDVSLALILAVAHYGGGVLVGLCMRYHGRSVRSPSASTNKSRAPILRQALAAMHAARLTDQRSLGQLLRESIQTGLKLVFMIGGLVVFISVILELLSRTGVLSLLFAITAGLLQMMSMPAELSPAFINGLFEVTLGAKASGMAGAAVPLMHKVAMAAFVLSWAGLSVHAQIASLLTHTNLRYGPFVFARALHGVIAALLVYLLWKPLSAIRDTALFALPVGSFGSGSWHPYILGLSGAVFIAVLALIPILYMLYILFSHSLSIMMRRTKG